MLLVRRHFKSVIIWTLRPPPTVRQFLYNIIIYNHIRYSLDFLRPIVTAEAFEAVDWLAALTQQTWPKASQPVE